MSNNAALSFKSRANFGAAGLALSLIGSMKEETASIGVQCDLRIINAQTGEVVWAKRVTGVDVISKESIGAISSGSTKFNNELYVKALDNAAQDIVNAMTSDIKVRMLI